MRNNFFVTLILIFLFAGFSSNIFCQSTEKIYDPDADALAQLNEAITKAGTENKFVLVQIGGNWCPWCHKLHHFILDNSEIKDFINANFVLVRVNYSKENKNTEVLKRLRYPQRFGFPVLCILDGKGNLIHTQDTGLLEKDKSYDKKKLMGFLVDWSPAALDGSKYK